MALVLIMALLLGVVATGIGGLLIGASAVRTILGVRRIRRGVVALLAATALVGLTGYTAYVGAIGSDQLIHPTGNPDCRTPLVRYGWTYEAVNYDIADDAVLQDQNPDMAHCASQGVTAGTEVVTTDGIPIAGWYIPAADGVGPTGTTVVIVHGWDANKSEALKYAVPLHAAFNVVVIDLRGGGRSGPADSTFGLREQLDVEAVIDWLQRTKHPAHIAVMGNSMGGGSRGARRRRRPAHRGPHPRLHPCPRREHLRAAPGGRRRPSRRCPARPRSWPRSGFARGLI